MLCAAVWCAGCKRQPAQTGSGRSASIVRPGAEDWPWWRGVKMDGHAQGPPPPVFWSEQENIVWKMEVPGRGHASPVLWGERIFLATADEARQTQSLVCVRRSDGAMLWQTELHRGGFMHSDRKNSHATPTPACDGERVFTAFMTQGGIWVSAVSVEGKILWQKKAVPFQSEYGYASCPLVWGELVIVAADNPLPSQLTALDRATGEVAWQTPRAKGNSYGSPVVARIAGRPQLLLNGQGTVAAYDPASGRPIWHCRGLDSFTVSTVAWHGELVFAGSDAGVLCVRANGAGDVTGSHVEWRRTARSYVPSPLVVGDYLLVVQDSGFLTCFDAATGRQHWKERLGGNISASPVAAGELVYLPNESGRTYVFKPGRTFELVAENDLNGTFLASPVIAGGRLHLRSDRFLYCIGETKTSGQGHE